MTNLERTALEFGENWYRPVAPASDASPEDDPIAPEDMRAYHLRLWRALHDAGVDVCAVQALHARIEEYGIEAMQLAWCDEDLDEDQP